MSQKLDKNRNTSDELDITSDLCPMTFVKSKLFLEKKSRGDIVGILITDGEPLENLPQALAQDGHVVHAVEPTGSFYHLTVEVRTRSTD